MCSVGYVGKNLKKKIIRLFFIFFFQAEDGIRDAQESRGLGDVYKRQAPPGTTPASPPICAGEENIP